MGEPVYACYVTAPDDHGRIECQTHGWQGLLMEIDEEEHCPYAPLARGRTGGVAASARPATSGNIVSIPSIAGRTTNGSGPTRRVTARSGIAGRSRIASTWESTSLNSVPSAEPPSDSKPPLPVPTDVRALASQANEIATRVLRGEFTSETELRQVSLYASLVRTITQAMGLGVSHARFVKTEPTLNFDTIPPHIDPQSQATGGLDLEL
jgi:hypothetical protein